MNGSERILTTGARSGLGKYLFERLGGAGLTRENARALLEHGGAEWDAIVHCAFSSESGIDSRSVYGYCQDTIFLTRALAALPHRKFIFVSSVEVYPKNGARHQESEVIPMENTGTFYGAAKLIAEGIVLHEARNALILRPTSLLGPYMRRNNLIAVLEGKPCAASLSADSVLNFVLYSDLFRFVKAGIELGLAGVWNIASASNITFQEIVALAGMEGKIAFGAHRYDVGLIDAARARVEVPELSRTSAETLKEFMRQWKESARSS